MFDFDVSACVKAVHWQMPKCLLLLAFFVANAADAYSTNTKKTRRPLHLSIVNRQRASITTCANVSRHIIIALELLVRKPVRVWNSWVVESQYWLALFFCCSEAFAFYIPFSAIIRLQRDNLVRSTRLAHVTLSACTIVQCVCQCVSLVPPQNKTSTTN